MAWYDFLAGSYYNNAVDSKGNPIKVGFGQRLATALEGFGQGLQGQSGTQMARASANQYLGDRYLSERRTEMATLREAAARGDEDAAAELRTRGSVTPDDQLALAQFYGVRPTVSTSRRAGKLYKKGLPGGRAQDFYETPSGELVPWGDPYERSSVPHIRPRHEGNGWWRDYDAEGNPVGEPYQMKPGSMPPWWMMMNPGFGGPWGGPSPPGNPTAGESGAAPGDSSSWPEWATPGFWKRSWHDWMLDPGEPSDAEARLDDRY